MASPLYLTLLAGPVEAVPVPKPLIDALTSVEVTESATGRSGFQLTFTLANNSILQTLFLLAGGAPIPVLRVILVVSFGGLPQVIMDGIIQHHEVVPDAAHGASKLVVTGQDLSALMDLIDFTGLPYPGMSPDIRVLTILAKYAAFGIVPEVIPVPVPDVPVPLQQTPRRRNRPRLHPAACAGGGICLLRRARPVAGHEPGVLGTADSSRSSATCAQRQHGFLDQRRKPELPLSAAELRDAYRLYPGPDDERHHSDSDSAGDTVQSSSGPGRSYAAKDRATDIDRQALSRRRR